ncbi:MAG: shikimate kinase, partial [Thermoplasmata archaeon]|nr:shikimate kinase [Thermoplasmata archaeon]
MIGTGRCFAAITIVNALFTGVGAAAAISIPVDARVELTERPSGTETLQVIRPPAETPLVRSSLVSALNAFGPGRAFDVELSIHSNIPPSRGLKSSSAVSTAVISAVAAGLGVEAPPELVAGISADVSRRVGLSATGAFDDALASVAGGCVVTENRAHRKLREIACDPEWRVALWVPAETHRPSPEWGERFAARSGEGRAAAQLAEKGDLLGAMARNTTLVEKVMGYEYGPLREGLRRLGAVGSGVSGMGPTIAA